MVAGAGFEPAAHDAESCMLPLHYPAICNTLGAYRLSRSAPQRVIIVLQQVSYGMFDRIKKLAYTG